MTSTPRWFSETSDGHSQWYIERFRTMEREGVDLGAYPARRPLEAGDPSVDPVEESGGHQQTHGGVDVAGGRGAHRGQARADREDRQRRRDDEAPGLCLLAETTPLGFPRIRLCGAVGLRLASCRPRGGDAGLGRPADSGPAHPASGGPVG